MNKNLQQEESKLFYGIVYLIKILAVIALVYFFLYALNKADDVSKSSTQIKSIK